jgi:hypothetical protein
MRKAINFLGWIGVFSTIFTLILTLLTTYQFIYIKYFDSYYTLQWCIFFTMITWAAKMFESKVSLKNIGYPIACMLIAVGTAFFIYMRVY